MRRVDPLNQVHGVHRPRAHPTVPVHSDMTLARNAVAERQLLQDCAVLQTWVESVLQSKVPPKQDLIGFLQDGVALCQMMNKLHPGACTSFSKSKHPFLCMNNIQEFLTACQRLGMPRGDLFEAADLFEQKNIPQVVASLLAFATLHRKEVGSSSAAPVRPVAVQQPIAPKPVQEKVVQHRPTPVVIVEPPRHHHPAKKEQPSSDAPPPPPPRDMDDDCVVPPSPPIAAVTPRTKQRTKAAARVMDKPSLIRQPAFTPAVAPVVQPQHSAVSDVLHGEELDAAVRKYLFGIHLNHPSFRTLVENANLVRASGDAFQFRGTPIQVKANRNGEVFVKRGNAWQPMIEWMDRRFVQQNDSPAKPLRPMATQASDAAVAAVTPTKKRSSHRKKRAGSHKKKKNELTPRAQENASFDEVAHLRQLLAQEGNPLEFY